ncbi:outer membrane protein [Mesorhizobium sp. ANAO-SY3R2]|uniref:outer membrane protein n=1 Tax=Mesorhizobium sp. ANAO-SY3R2 TaxID=3166644 RepID=UPI003670CEE8
MKAILFASTLLGISAGQAVAADAIATTPPTFVWTGGYIGLQAGHAWGDAGVSYVYPGVSLFSSPDPDGFVGGVYAGYNHQFTNNVVLGVDADIAWTEAKSGFQPFNIFTRAAVDVAYTAALRARIGYASDRWLPYVSGGLAISRAEISYDMVVQDAIVKDTLAGWTLGAGVEYAANDKLVVRAEYRYSDYGNGTAKPSAFPSFPNDRAAYDLRSSDIRLGVAYKF